MAENKDSKQKIAIEIGLNTDQYALLDKKARQFSKDGENISVENLVKLLVVKSGLELDLLESTTLTELKKEVYKQMLTPIVIVGGFVLITVVLIIRQVRKDKKEK